MDSSRPRRVLLLSHPVLAAGLLAVAAVAVAAAPALATSGGADAPIAGGGTGYGTPLARVARQPVASVFRVAPQTLTVGAVPRLAVRIDQSGVRSVDARIVLKRRGGGNLHVDLGIVATGRLLHPAWPAGVSLTAGTYVVGLHARDPSGAVLKRKGRDTGRAELIVKQRKVPAVSPAPAPVAPTPVAVPTPVVAPVAAPDPGITAAGVFPVAGAHTYGGADARFGAGRTGHVHQGQDVLAAEGTPVLAPEAGTIITVGYQAAAAGYYVAMDAVDGRAFFFAHCQDASTTVSAGQAVTAGQQLCRIGHTGDATGPHLHFEIWIGGWRRNADSQPVDPLAQLQAWDR